jgi:hypothetical protein
MVGNNISILLTVLIGVGLSMLTISSISFLGLTESFSQTTETQSKSSSSLHITKHSSNSYALSSGSSHIGSFDTTYNILGSVSSIKESKDLITSTIINDYDKSPFIGYVIVQKGKSSSSDSSKSLGLANPFADKATINAKIKSEIQKAIDSTNKINTKEAVIKCNFGMEISKWNCSTHGLIG